MYPKSHSREGTVILVSLFLVQSFFYFISSPIEASSEERITSFRTKAGGACSKMLEEKVKNRGGFYVDEPFVSQIASWMFSSF